MKLKKEIISKVVGIFTVISALIALISGLYRYLLPMYLAHKFQLDVKGASSIGIIGGADGPTAIFVSGQSSFYWLTIITTLFTIAGIIYRKYAINDNRDKAPKKQK